MRAEPGDRMGCPREEHFVLGNPDLELLVRMGGTKLSTSKVWYLWRRKLIL